MPTSTRAACPILVVDDDLAGGELAHALCRRGHAAEWASSGPACLDRLAGGDAAIVLVDVIVGEMSGLDLCRELRERFGHVLPIVLTARREASLAIAALRAGAYDYVLEPVALDELDAVLARASEELAVRRELDRLRAGPVEPELDGLVAGSPSIEPTLELARRVARSDATILVTGESGAGKERIARAIHAMSERRTEPFVAISSSALTVPLLESELFGHVRGAFSGAERERVGLFLHAGRGTILLDEIAEMPLEVQAKLLRVLQERSVRPLGADEEVPLHARVIAATSRDLELEVVARRFRKDLYHRINVVAVPVPPLRERREDILPLAYHVLSRDAARTGKPVRAITPTAARALLAYDWPGNVRELENCIERAVAVCALDQLAVADLPDRVRLAIAPAALIGDAPARLVTLAEMKRDYLRTTLALCRGNKSRAARVLGIDRRTISSALEAAKPPEQAAHAAREVSAVR